MKKDTILLPNLLFKNKNIYFKFKQYFELNINGKKILFDNFLLNDIPLYGTIYFKNIKINCDILEKENSSGLFVELRYNRDDYFILEDIQKISKEIELMILNIDNPDYYRNNQDIKNNKSNIKSEEEESNSSLDFNENYSNYYNSNNYETGPEKDEISDSSFDDLNDESNSYRFSKFNST
jgi:hypothetical protein